MVLPEDLVTLPRGARLLAHPGRKVIFNQNVHHGFTSLGAAVPEPYPYLHPSVTAVLTVSEHNRRLLKFAFPRVHTPHAQCARKAPHDISESPDLGERRALGTRKQDPSNGRHLADARRRILTLLGSAASPWVSSRVGFCRGREVESPFLILQSGLCIPRAILRHGLPVTEHRARPFEATRARTP